MPELGAHRLPRACSYPPAPVSMTVCPPCVRAQRMLTGTSLDHSVDPPSPDQLAAAGKTAAQLAHVHE